MMDQPNPSLHRSFSVWCIGVFVVALLALAGLYRHISVHQLIAQSERANVALTKSFANALWPEVRSYLKDASGLSGDALRARPETAEIKAAIRGQMHGLSVLKVKIYDRHGLTVFSSEPAQMGADKSESPGFRAAADGRVISALTFRDTFYSLEGTISDRDIVSSYIPLYANGSGDLEGVFEIYDDVTEPLGYVETLQWTMNGLVAIILLFSFGLLAGVVARGAAVGAPRPV